MNRYRARNRLRLTLVIVTALLTCLFVVGIRWYVGWSASHLPVLADQLGTVWMACGEQREAAGALEEALSLYETALSGYLPGPQDRNHAEKRCGTVLYRLGRYEEALVHLERAQESAQRTLNGFRPWADTLIALDRWEEAGEVVRAWEAAAVDHDGARADAYQYHGRLAMHAGDFESAVASFEVALALVPEHRCRADLARLHAARGDREAAVATMTAFLATAPPDAATANQWALLAEWSTE